MHVLATWTIKEKEENDSEFFNAEQENSDVARLLAIITKISSGASKARYQYLTMAEDKKKLSHGISPKVCHPVASDRN